MPDCHSSKDRDKIGADRHVKSVIEEKSKRWRAGLHPVLWFPSGGKKVNRTAKPTVHRQASVQNPQSRDNVVQIWIVVVAQWAMNYFFLPTDIHVLPTTRRILPTPPQVLPTPYVPTGPAICVDLGLNPASLGNVQFCPIRIKYLSLSVQGIRTDWTGITAVDWHGPGGGTVCNFKWPPEINPRSAAR